MNNLKKLIVAPFCVAGLLVAPLTIAEYAPPPQQQQQQHQAAPPQQTQQVDISDSQLETYVQASSKVDEVRNEYQQKMSNAESAEQAQELQQEALQQMASVVESAGLSVDEYNLIANQLQTNTDLRQRYESLQ